MSKIFILISVLFLSLTLTSCATMQKGSSLEDSRAAFNKDTQVWEATSCDNPDKVMRYKSCMKLVNIFSMKSDGTFNQEITTPDGTITKTNIDNGGPPDAIESISKAITTLAITKSINDD